MILTVEKSFANAKRLLFAISLILISIDASSLDYEPAGTYLFATRDNGQELYLDHYPAKQTDTCALHSELVKSKPAILFLFGGGFVMGARNDGWYKPWYKALNDKGYDVFAMDYRLGLVGVKYSKSVRFAKALDKAIGMVVDDIFSATAFLIDNSSSFGIDPDNLVLCGCSAGAISSLQSEYLICKGSEKAKLLPKGFNYAGVVSFSGAVFSMRGKVRYPTAPCPQLLFHGTEDGIVPYSMVKVFSICFEGSDALASCYQKNDFNYCIYRFVGKNHEIAASMCRNIDYVLEFLEKNVKTGEKRVIDREVDAPDIVTPDWAKKRIELLYE